MEPITWALIAAGAGLFLYAKSKTTSLSSTQTGAGNNPSTGTSGSESTTSVTTSNGGTVYPYVTSGAPDFPSVYNQQYYLQYIYPNMQKANPNILNPNYTLTANDAAQYILNYDNVNTWANLPSTLNSSQVSAQGGGILGACRYHWKTYGVPQQRTFLWLYPPDTTAYVAPPGKSSSGSIFSTILSDVASVAGAAISLAGINDIQLNALDIELLVNGCAIVKNSIGLFANEDPGLVSLIDNRIDEVLTQIA